MKIPFVMVGAGGRMGRAIIALAQEYKDNSLELCGAIENPKSPYIGEDAGRLSGIKDLNIKITSNYKDVLPKAKVVIDFSSPASSIELLKHCVLYKIPCVIGSTGFSSKEREELKSFSEKIPLLWASNMSLGVNVLLELVHQASNFLSPNFDVEISEIHHHLKKDSPSGTALSLLEAVKENTYYKDFSVQHGREGIVGERPKNEIGLHALRGGDVIGEHTVFFLGNGERIELSHKASSRNCFAQGALESAYFLGSGERDVGMYSIKDILRK